MPASSPRPVMGRVAIGIVACGLWSASGSLAQGWAPQVSGTPTVGLLDVHFVDENTGYVAGNLATFLSTYDGGQTWTQRSTGLSAGFPLNAVWFTSAAVGFVAGGSSTLRKSTDSGKTWAPVLPTNLTLELNALHFGNPRFGCAVGREVSGGVLAMAAYCTQDSGSTWIPRTLLPSWNLRAVHLVGDRLGYTAGDSGLVFRTVDSGSTWSNRSLGVRVNLNGVHFANPDTGWVVGNSGNIHKTLDGGLNWTPQNSGTTQNLNEVHFHGRDTGYAVGNNGTLLKTLDGGANWLNDSFTSLLWFYGVHFPASGIGYVVGINGSIHKTTPTTGLDPRFNRAAKTNRNPGFHAQYFLPGVLERWFDLRGRGFRVGDSPTEIK